MNVMMMCLNVVKLVLLCGVSRSSQCNDLAGSSCRASIVRSASAPELIQSNEGDEEGNNLKPVFFYVESDSEEDSDEAVHNCFIDEEDVKKYVDEHNSGTSRGP